MAEPKIDPEWNDGNDDIRSQLKALLAVGIPLILIIGALILSLSYFKGSTSLGKEGQKDVYSPVKQENEGFVGKANNLLLKLLQDCDSSITATDLASLNKKYRALTFALPYSEKHKAVIEASDLRLVGINAERIKNEKDRMFYYNSRLPQLLKQQEEQKDETFFKLRFNSLMKQRNENARPIEITTLEVIPGMFKVALSKDPWVGIIEGNKNSLFNEDSYIFLSFGSSVLPLPIKKNHRSDGILTTSFTASIQDAELYTSSGKNISYYDYYKLAENTEKPAKDIKLSIRETAKSQELGSISLSCDSSTIQVSSNLTIRVFRKQGEMVELNPETYSGSQLKDTISIENGLKFVAYSKQGNKYGEFTVNTKDPTRILSCLIQTNVGRQRYTLSRNMTDLFTQQLVRGVSRNISNSYNVDTVKLSVDPLLSKEFEEELKSHIKVIIQSVNNKKKQMITKYPTLVKGWQDHELYDISMTIMDMATGDVIASPFYTSRFDDKDYPENLYLTTRNPALSRRYIGSTFKPMLALAAVEANPKLLNLDTHTAKSYSLNEDKTTATFFGRNVNSWAKKSPSHWYGCTFVDFLSHSDDVYPVALATLAMTGKDLDGNKVTTLPVDEKNNFFTVNKKNNRLLFKKDNDENAVDIRNHAFTTWLSYLYAANQEQESPTDTLFRNLTAKNNLDGESRQFGLDEVSFDATNLHMERFLDGDNFRSNLAPWVLGQRDNEWSCIKLAEAWSRMLSKRDIKASFIKGSSEPQELITRTVSNNPPVSFNYVNPDLNKVNSTWNSFLEKFQTAQSNTGSNTLIKMYNQVKALNTNVKTDLVLFSKTGTPDSYIRDEFHVLGGNNRHIDIGMYTFALMRQGEYDKIKNLKPGHGIVCVIRVTRTYECRYCHSTDKPCKYCEEFDGLDSGNARDFLAASQTRLRKFYDMTKSYY